MAKNSYTCAVCAFRNGSINCATCDDGSNFVAKEMRGRYDYTNGYGRKAAVYCQADLDMTKAMLTNIRQAINPFAIEKVHFNNPATVVLWKDGTKTVVKCGENDLYDPEKGLAMAIAKKALGNKGNYYNEIRKWVEPETEISEVAYEIAKALFGDKDCKDHLK